MLKRLGEWRRRQWPRGRKTAPRVKLSLVVCAYNMPRELPRTIQSLSPGMQRGVDASDYEILIVDNGSTRPFSESACRSCGADIRVFRLPRISPSPAAAANLGIREARGDLIGVLIDGARLASPGLVRLAAMADKLAPRVVVLTVGFHLGPAIQSESIAQGYDRETEDKLLDEARWTEDGYRLFNISVFAASARRGWFGLLNESNAIFMRRELWDELGGFDERFQTPGGGLVNLDMFHRAVQLPGVVVVTLLGEGTFHQVHGGVATNAVGGVGDTFVTEYEAIHGRQYLAAAYRSFYFGAVPPDALASIRSSAELAVARRPPEGA